MASFSIINPYTNKIIESRHYEELANVDIKIEALQHGFSQWKKKGFENRKKTIKNLANGISKQKDTLAELICTDMGKPINEAKKEIQKSIDCCKYYSDISHKIEQALNQNHIRREPLGIILGIMPWNYPLWQIIRYAIPSLITGNTCLIKPAFNTVRIAEELVKICNNPEIMNLCIPTNDHTEEVIKKSSIAGVSFTGSVPAGKIVGGISTQHLKPCVLELGGSDPFIVFKDANLETAINFAFQSRFTNAGQVCIAAKRFLFEDDIFESALNLFKEKTQSMIHYGNPLNESTTIGPLARIDIKNNLQIQLNNAELTKENIAYEYSTNDHLGNFFPPMIIDGRNLSSDNTLYQEETFGPIAVCDSFNSVNNAIEKANHSRFGLGASVWTSNKTTTNKCIENIECGNIAINTNVHSSFDTPFGGRKQSGLGLELGLEGALSFTGIKTILNKKS